MKLIFHIAIHEIKVLYRNFFLLGSVLAILITALPAALVLIEIQEEERGRFLHDRLALTDQVSRLPGLARFPLVVSVPPPPLSFLNRGITDQVSLQVSFSRLDPPRMQPRREDGSWLGYFFPPFDMATLCAIFFSLVPFLFAYGCFSREKESGTLKIVMSNSLPMWKLIAGKLAGLSIALAAPLATMLLVSLGVLLSSPAIRSAMQTSDWVGFWFFFAAVAAYGLIHLQIAMLASLVTHKPANTLFVLLTFWMASMVLVPSLGLEAAGWAAPSPPNGVLAQNERLLHADLLLEYSALIKQATGATFVFRRQDVEKPGRRYFLFRHDNWQFHLTREGEFWLDRADAALQGRMKSGLPDMLKRQNRIVNELRSLYQDRRQRMIEQIRFTRAAALLSPSALLSTVTAEGIGSGAGAVSGFHAWLQETAYRFYTRLTESPYFLSDKFFLRLGEEERIEPSLIPNLELFDRARTGLGPDRVALTLGIGYLAFLMLLLFFATFVLGSRYDPR
ncbi:MAG TPA: ABC transporter permease subunit [Acidobacteriota bacterium]|nr:ABC transporter permease subunit [Acidobacteriota bacterium]